MQVNVIGHMLLDIMLADQFVPKITLGRAIWREAETSMHGLTILRFISVPDCWYSIKARRSAMTERLYSTDQATQIYEQTRWYLRHDSGNRPVCRVLEHQGAKPSKCCARDSRHDWIEFDSVQIDQKKIGPAVPCRYTRHVEGDSHPSWDHTAIRVRTRSF